MNSDYSVTTSQSISSHANRESIDGESTLIATLRLFGVAPGASYGLLLRDGRVLCALPTCRAEALRILSLYQPQRPKAKLLALGFRYFALLGLHSLVLKRWKVPAHPLDQNVVKQENPPGVMIGSSGHLCERSVVCLRLNSEWQVCKIAFGSVGHEILSHEATMLRALTTEFPNIPQVIDFTHNGEATLLRMPYQDGLPWRQEDLAPLLELLESWSDRDEVRALSDFPEWIWIESALRRFPKWENRIASLAALRVRPSIRHGDLTRPNLRLNNNGKLLVHDWERGSLNGIPGIDLVHFLVQDRLFRKRMSPSAVVDSVLEELSTGESAKLLRHLGWAVRENELMAICLALNIGAGYIDQSTLITCLA
jgi:hypothetical protein